MKVYAGGFEQWFVESENPNRVGAYYRVWIDQTTRVSYCSHAEQFGMPPYSSESGWCKHMHAVMEKLADEYDEELMRARSTGFEEGP